MNENNIKVSGMLKCPSNLDANVIEVHGALKVEQSIKANELQGHGMVKVLEDVFVSMVDMHGMLKTGKKLKSEHLKLNGLIKAQSIEGEEIYINGGLQIEEDINCDKLEIILQSKSKLGHIEGTSINISARRRHVLKVNSITADDTTIENVVCESISGDRIVIGKNCDIKQITYKTSLEVHSSSKVKTQDKI